MRPKSYDDSPPLRSCCTCKHSHRLAESLDLMCFHGDDFRVSGHSEYPVRADYIELYGTEIANLSGDEYDKVWADRSVDSDATCQEWEASE